MTIHKTKLCRRCDTTKDSDGFYRRRTGNDLSPYCKPCTKAQTLERQRALKKKAVDYKGGKCQRCGYDEYDAALEFHHRDPDEKEFSLSHLNRTKWSQRTMDELDKCDLLCANCHRTVHFLMATPVLPENKTSKKEKKEYGCQDCGVILSNYRAKRCIPCQSKANQKIDWPPKEELQKLIHKMGYSATGRKLGVSDNAVKKALKRG